MHGDSFMTTRGETAIEKYNKYGPMPSRSNAFTVDNFHRPGLARRAVQCLHGPILLRPKGFHCPKLSGYTKSTVKGFQSPILARSIVTYAVTSIFLVSLVTVYGFHSPILPQPKVSIARRDSSMAQSFHIAELPRSTASMVNPVVL